MGRAFQELFGHWVQHVLGCDGMAAAVLLMGFLWFGHYALPGSGSRPRHRLVLVPVSIACLAASALVCSLTKFIILAAVALLLYFAYVATARAGRSG